jgi:hypothetical protein
MDPAQQREQEQEQEAASGGRLPDSLPLRWTVDTTTWRFYFYIFVGKLEALFEDFQFETNGGHEIEQ